MYTELEGYQNLCYSFYADHLFGKSLIKNLETVHRYFDDCEDEQVAKFFDYMARKMFDNGTAEEAGEILGDRIIDEHKEDLREFFNRIRRNQEVIEALPKVQSKVLLNRLQDAQARLKTVKNY